MDDSSGGNSDKNRDSNSTHSNKKPKISLRRMASTMVGFRARKESAVDLHQSSKNPTPRPPSPRLSDRDTRTYESDVRNGIYPAPPSPTPSLGKRTRDSSPVSPPASLRRRRSIAEIPTSSRSTDMDEDAGPGIELPQSVHASQVFVDPPNRNGSGHSTPKQNHVPLPTQSPIPNPTLDSVLTYDNSQPPSSYSLTASPIATARILVPATPESSVPNPSLGSTLTYDASQYPSSYSIPSQGDVVPETPEAASSRTPDIPYNMALRAIKHGLKQFEEFYKPEGSDVAMANLVHMLTESLTYAHINFFQDTRHDNKALDLAINSKALYLGGLKKAVKENTNIFDTHPDDNPDIEWGAAASYNAAPTPAGPPIVDYMDFTTANGGRGVGAAGPDAGARPQDNSQALILAELRKLSKRINVIEQHTSGQPAEGTQPANKASNGRPSFAQATRRNVQPQPKTPAQTKVSAAKIAEAIIKNPKEEPLRFVVRLLGKGPDYMHQLPPNVIGDTLNRILSQKVSGTKLLYARWNQAGNLILGFPYGSNESAIRGLFAEFLSALKLPNDTAITLDVPWSKVIVSSVPTGVRSVDGERFGNESLLSELVESNPWVSALVITQKPRWITRADNMGKAFSSFTFAFEDADGSNIRELLKKQLYLFATPVNTKRWTEKPILKGCFKCQGLDHTVAGCRRQARCANCGGNHHTEAHRAKCSGCASEKIPASEKCPHPLKCANCGGPHSASDSTCPTRTKFRVPINQILNRSNNDANMTHV